MRAAYKLSANLRVRCDRRWNIVCRALPSGKSSFIVYLALCAIDWQEPAGCRLHVADSHRACYAAGIADPLDYFFLFISKSAAEVAMEQRHWRAHRRLPVVCAHRFDCKWRQAIPLRDVPREQGPMLSIFRRRGSGR